MEYVSRNWLSSLVALPVIIFLISLSSGICSNFWGPLAAHFLSVMHTTAGQTDSHSQRASRACSQTSDHSVQ